MRFHTIMSSLLWQGINTVIQVRNLPSPAHDTVPGFQLGLHQLIQLIVDRVCACLTCWDHRRAAPTIAVLPLLPDTRQRRRQQFFPRSSFLISLHASSGVRTLRAPEMKATAGRANKKDGKTHDGQSALGKGGTNEVRLTSLSPLKPPHQGVKVPLLFFQ